MPLTDNDRLDALERRLRVVEDQLAIGQLLASYGPRPGESWPTTHMSPRRLNTLFH